MGLPRLLAALVLIHACGTPSSVVRTDLQAYVDRIQTWAPVEAETQRTITRILRTQFVDEGEVLRQIADCRPRVLGHLERVRAYSPRSPALAQIHDRYVAAWQGLLGGFDAIESGFATGDYTKLAIGRQAMETWEAAIVHVADDLSQLMQEFGVTARGTTES
jgi:hypothetical protein